MRVIVIILLSVCGCLRTMPYGGLETSGDGGDTDESEGSSDDGSDGESDGGSVAGQCDDYPGSLGCPCVVDACVANLVCDSGHCTPCAGGCAD